MWGQGTGHGGPDQATTASILTAIANQPMPTHGNGSALDVWSKAHGIEQLPGAQSHRQEQELLALTADSASGCPPPASGSQLQRAAATAGAAASGLLQDGAAALEARVHTAPLPNGQGEGEGEVEGSPTRSVGVADTDGVGTFGVEACLPRVPAGLPTAAAVDPCRTLP